MALQHKNAEGMKVTELKLLFSKHHLKGKKTELIVR